MKQELKFIPGCGIFDNKGPEPIKVLQDIAAGENVHYIPGNHDVMMIDILLGSNKKANFRYKSVGTNKLFIKP